MNLSDKTSGILSARISRPKPGKTKLYVTITEPGRDEYTRDFDFPEADYGARNRKAEGYKIFVERIFAAGRRTGIREANKIAQKLLDLS